VREALPPHDVVRGLCHRTVEQAGKVKGAETYALRQDLHEELMHGELMTEMRADDLQLLFDLSIPLPG
jgi:hypothetical protein